jgi:fructokinase
MRIGIDLGGTKTEVIALDASGTEMFRKRIATPADGYAAILDRLAELVREVETTLGRTGTVGLGIPGAISACTGCVKNANTTALNGHFLDQDLGHLLGREVRCMNDANCLALSEAVDGAGAGHRMVFAAILGTGCGAGIACQGRPWQGVNLVAGEWGHNPLPWMTAGEYPGPRCWCGKTGCIERWISGTGFADDYVRSRSGSGRENSGRLTGEQIVELARQGAAAAVQALERYANRLARSLAHVINILDPDVIVLGGGMSNVDELYELVPPQLPAYAFGREVTTPVVRSRHGDASGVRGAAWLWPQGKQ